MKVPDKDVVLDLSKFEIPSPKVSSTEDIIKSNGFISLIKKSDKTFALRNETSGEENGHFLTREDAEATYNEIVSEENNG